MTKEDPNYRLALDQAGESWSPPAGLTKGPSSNLVELSKQNNTIIELLISLHRRIARIESLVSGQGTSNLQGAIEGLTTQVQNLKLSENKGTETGTLVRKEPNTLAVWVDPRQQIEAFKAKLRK